MTSDRFRRTIWLAAALAWGLFCCPPLRAHVPPASFLLQQMRQALGRAEALVVRQQVSVLTGKDQRVGTELDETLKFWFPGRFRSDIDSPLIRRTQVVNGERRFTAVNGRIAAEAESRYDRYKDIFMEGTDAAPRLHPGPFGLDPEVSSPGRLDGRPVYVVGARYPDMTAAQIWLDKETFRPLRWVLPPAAGTREAGVLDVRYLGWRQVAALWYPKEIHFFVDGTPVRRIRVEAVEAVDGFEAALFDIELVQSALEGPPPILPGRPDPVEEVRKAIESFRKLYE